MSIVHIGWTAQSTAVVPAGVHRRHGRNLAQNDPAARVCFVEGNPADEASPDDIAHKRVPPPRNGDVINGAPVGAVPRQTVLGHSAKDGVVRQLLRARRIKEVGQVVDD